MSSTNSNPMDLLDTTPIDLFDTTWREVSDCTVEEQDFLHVTTDKYLFIESRLENSPLNKILCQ